jgi:hypothetical protein
MHSDGCVTEQCFDSGGVDEDFADFKIHQLGLGFHRGHFGRRDVTADIKG